MRKLPKVVYRKLGREQAWGQAHYDCTPRLIEVDPRLGAKRQLEVLIHEQLHLSFGPDMPEKEVNRVGREICETLWRQEYRRVLLDKNSKPPRIT